MARTACFIGLLAYGIAALTASRDGALSRFLARPPERPDSTEINGIAVEGSQ